jgi:hypothetical protein
LTQRYLIPTRRQMLSLKKAAADTREVEWSFRSITHIPNMGAAHGNVWVTRSSLRCTERAQSYPPRKVVI